jgi:hypothetical protein
MTNRRALLNNLLRTLVAEWGYNEVHGALMRLSHNSTTTDVPDHQNDEGAKKPRARLLASEQVARAHITDAQVAATLQKLATRFDHKQFLPSVSDIREFLVMMGKRPGTIKDRSAGFRLLLIALSGLPADSLERLANSASYSGPSHLGPLSDAISDAASSLPRHRYSGDT